MGSASAELINNQPLISKLLPSPLGVTMNFHVVYTPISGAEAATWAFSSYKTRGPASQRYPTEKKMLRAAPVPLLPGKEHHKLPRLSSAQQEFGLCCRDSYGRANKASSFHLGRACLLSRCPPFGICTERSVAGTDAAGALALLGAADQCLGLDRAGRAQALWVLHSGGLILGKKGENAPKRSSTRKGVCHK